MNPPPPGQPPPAEAHLKAQVRRAMNILDAVGRHLADDDFLAVNEASVLLQDTLYNWGKEGCPAAAARIAAARDRLTEALKRGLKAR